MIPFPFAKWARSSLISEQKFCAVDVEATGLDLHSDEIIAFACVPIEHARIMVHQAYYTLVRPEGYRIDAMKYHGIGPTDLSSAPTFAEVSDRILRCLDGILIGHSIHYDHELLRRQFKRLGKKLTCDTMDIQLVERWLERACGRVGQEEGLDAIMDRYGLRDCYRHNALADAFFAAQIFQMQTARLERLGVKRVRQLRNAARSCRFAAW